MTQDRKVSPGWRGRRIENAACQGCHSLWQTLQLHDHIESVAICNGRAALRKLGQALGRLLATELEDLSGGHARDHVLARERVVDTAQAGDLAPACPDLLGVDAPHFAIVTLDLVQEDRAPGLLVSLHASGALPGVGKSARPGNRAGDTGT